MPIQRQSESFGIFDDGPRFARDRSSTELPRGLAGILNTGGPRITGGMLNTRQAGFPMDSPYGLPGPRDHGGAGPDGGPALPDWYYDGDSEDDDEYAPDSDPERFVPENFMDYPDRTARRGSGRHPFDFRTAAPRGEPDMEYEPEMEEHLRKVYQYDPRFFQHKCMYPTRGIWDGYPTCAEDRAEGSQFCPAHKDRADAADAKYKNSDENWFMGSRHPFDRTAADAAVADPAAMAPQLPVGGGFQAGHRVGLDWRDSTVPGTVIANDGQVHVRWDDGQYTSEDPTEVHLL